MWLCVVCCVGICVGIHHGKVKAELRRHGTHRAPAARVFGSQRTCASGLPTDGEDEQWYARLAIIPDGDLAPDFRDRVQRKRKQLQDVSGSTMSGSAAHVKLTLSSHPGKALCLME